MKCPNCEQDNKDDIKKCKKCGLDLTIPSIWKPKISWHVKALIGIYAFLIIVYIVLQKIVK
jgi:hypothetical protein